MNNKEQRIVDELRMKEELYRNDMLDEYFYYADDIEDLVQNLVHAVKLGQQLYILSTFKVFSSESDFECISIGCRLLYTEPNRKKTWLSVFVFEDTRQLHEVLTELQNKLK